VWTSLSPVTLTWGPSYVNLTRIPCRCTGWAKMNVLSQGFRKLSSDIYTDRQTERHDQNYKVAALWMRQWWWHKKFLIILSEALSKLKSVILLLCKSQLTRTCCTVHVWWAHVWDCPVRRCWVSWGSSPIQPASHRCHWQLVWTGCLLRHQLSVFEKQHQNT